MQEVYVVSRGVADSRCIWWQCLAVLRRVVSGTCDPILVHYEKKANEILRHQRMAYGGGGFYGTRTFL